ncbi:MAG: malonyl-ACP O-methyltransferase BioC [Methylovulum sp.]|nr:malonyl-ACP O-methyltransferase BioC [Methylovulum sp.]
MPEKIRIKQSFSAAASSYDKVALLQRKVGKQLLQTIDPASVSGTLLDLGCGTGFLTGELLDLAHGGQVIALDMAFAMLKTAQTKLPADAPVHYVCADAEHLPLADHSVDVVFSNLALQWCSQLDSVFADLKRVLKPGGQLVFSTFGTDTLQELKTAWASVDNYAHVNEFHDKSQLQQQLQQAGFKEIQLDSSLYLSRYDGVLALMQELKQLGAHNVLAGRNPRLTTKASMQQMIVAYQDLCGYDGISASFEVISGVALA